MSFRLGGTDGVSVEAAKWEWALARLGFATRRVAGEVLDGGRPDDVVIPELAMYAGARAAPHPRGPRRNLRFRRGGQSGEAAAEPSPGVVESALEGADLVVVDNLLSLPLALAASRVVAEVVARHDRVVLRHHDLAWQRPEYAGVDELPPRLDRALHVVINEMSRRELAERGVEAHLVRNHFDLSPPPGDRGGTRERLGLGADDLLVLHPVRAVPRKNVPGALALCEALAEILPARRVHYWLPGPAEDGYGPALDEHLRAARVEVVREPARPVHDAVHDAYAACDLVAFPSTWEGFGNPVVESVAARRPLAAGRYPALDELLALGFEFLDAADPEGVAAALSGTRDLAPVLDRNLGVAREHLDLDLLPGRIEALLGGAGRTAAEGEDLEHRV